MGLARDLVTLEEALRRSEHIDLFSPLEGCGLLDSPEASSMLERLRTVDLRDPAGVMRLCLQALRVQHDEAAPLQIDAELVATLPPGLPGIARPTGQVMHEMLSHRAREVVLLGYEVTDEDMLTRLVGVSSRGAKVIMICDRARGSALRLLKGWPAGTQQPRVFQDREREDGAPYASMHAKCLLVDGKDLLITSANFTFHGLHGNIEIGVRLCGPPVAEARKIFSHLVENRLVEEVY